MVIWRTMALAPGVITELGANEVTAAALFEP
jgi:hypothetical protein